MFWKVKNVMSVSEFLKLGAAEADSIRGRVSSHYVLLQRSNLREATRTIVRTTISLSNSLNSHIDPNDVNT